MATKTKSVKYCPSVGVLESPYEIGLFKEFQPVFGQDEVRQAIQEHPPARVAHTTSVVDFDIDPSLPETTSLLSYDTKHNTGIITLYATLLSITLLVLGVVASFIGSYLHLEFLNSIAQASKSAAITPLALLIARHIIETLDILAISILRRLKGQAP